MKCGHDIGLSVVARISDCIPTGPAVFLAFQFDLIEVVEWLWRNY